MCCDLLNFGFLVHTILEYDIQLNTGGQRFMQKTLQQYTFDGSFEL